MKTHLPILVVNACLLLTLNGRLAAQDGPAPDNPETHAPPGLIQTAPPRHMDFVVSLPWIGRVESRRQVTVTALESGEVTKVGAEDQSAVRAGDPLFTLGGSEIQNRLDQLQERAKALRERVAVAEDLLDRKKRAAEQQLATAADLDAARASWLETRSELDATTQSLHSLRSRLQILAPIDGTFTQRKVSAGQVVGKGEALADIIDSDSLRIVARMFPDPDTDLDGRAVIVRADTGTTVTARVVHQVPQRTSLGETVVWIEGDAIEGRFLPGEPVRGNVVLDVRKDSLAVPRAALLYDENEKPLVYVEDAKRYRPIPVTTGATDGEWVEIESGLTGREQVLTHGAYEIHHRDFNRVFKVND